MSHDLLVAGAGQQSDDRGRFRFRVIPFNRRGKIGVHQRMSDKSDRNVTFSVIALLKGQNDRHMVHTLAYFFDPAPPPRPDLRADIVKYGDAEFLCGSCKMKVKIRKIDEYQKIGGDSNVKKGRCVMLSISIKGIMKTGLRIFAGVCNWREVTDKDKTITCSKKEGGVVEYGILKETGEQKRTIDFDGKKVEISEESFQALKKQFQGE